MVEQDNKVGIELYNKSPRIVFSDGTSPESEVLFQNKRKELVEFHGGLENGEGYDTYVSDFIEIPDGTTITEFITHTPRGDAFACFYDENYNFISTYSRYTTAEIPDNCIYMQVSDYNQLFGTQYNSSNLQSFIPHDVKITHYSYTDVELKTPLVTFNARIEKLISGNTCVSKEVAEKLAINQVYKKGFYINNLDNVSKILDLMTKYNYKYQFAEIDAVKTMTKAVDAFVPIFELIGVFLCVGTIFLLSNFSTRMINGKKHEIGILKALGTRNIGVAAIFGTQIILIAIFTCLFSTIGYYFFIDLANEVLVSSLSSLTERLVLNLEFLTFKSSVVIVNCGLIILLTSISLLVPMIKIKGIKPVKIIKAKE